ncbi:MAG: hypothetical protein JNL72_05815 [Flavipsychrobacter sp.]|nr:hypothetical protein [Flavipsychrobacter sp.]
MAAKVSHKLNYVTCTMFKKIARRFRDWRQKEALPLKLDNYWVYEVTENGHTERVTTRVKGVVPMRDALFFQLEGWGCNDHTYYRNNEQDEVEQIFYFNNDVWKPGVIKLITQPVREGYLYLYTDADGVQNGGLYAAATADQSVINGYQCTSLIEETITVENKVVHKMRCWWGDGIGYARIQYFQAGAEGEFTLYREQVLVSARFW